MEGWKTFLVLKKGKSIPDFQRIELNEVENINGRPVSKKGGPAKHDTVRYPKNTESFTVILIYC